MRVLAPGVTCIITSHMKPYLRTALASVLDQTRLDTQVIVVDSGQWHRLDTNVARAVGAVYRDYHDHPLVEWYSTGETSDLRDRVCPVSWATNQVIRAGLVRGRYVCTFYDDDRYEPTFFARMAGYLDADPAARAVWCSQKRAVLLPSGDELVEGEIRATGPRYPGQLDQLVDGTQVMLRSELLSAIGDPWLPEDPTDASCRHSDGVFLERVARAAGEIPAIDEFLVTHRFTPLSAYTPRTV